ncbi:MAG: T9SS type A sorting domain-containing protein [Bacteroidetes bacterium]|nr:T9SS type A sorting domain-containing protein [Bacteroidota bacterium]
MRKILFLLFALSQYQFTFSQPGEWTWMHGSSAPGGAGNYGTMGIPAPANEPPAVYEPMEWTDLNGNFWLYGGRSITGDFFNALWKYNPVTNEWVWVNGLNTPNDPGNYGTQGVSSPLNRPPSRGWAAATWTDLNNNLWVFGGEVGSFSGYNDLWKYDINLNEWTWMKGSNTTGGAGVYGTQGVPGILNNPGGRWECAGSWTDNAGDLWLFGGYNGAPWNDLWRFQISTNEWTWMKGSPFSGATSVYGNLGVEDPANTPSSRASYSRWKDLNGNLWLFGGDIYGQKDDMWKYNPLTNNWAWMSGDTLPGAIPNHGTKCVSSPSNTPGDRMENRACWTDQNGNFWFIGGNGSAGLYNDLWKYCTTTYEWTWVSGDTSPNGPGNWGTMGVSSPLNKPDARAGSSAWFDGNGGLYFFGGSAVPYATTSMNDLWKFVIDPSCAFCNSLPSAIFSAPNHICPGTCTDFNNISLNATSFLWTFAGANPSTSTDVSPTNICYNTPGTYTVSLIATNANGSDTLTLNNFITVYPYPAPQGIAQSGDTLFANQGAVSYQWYHNGISIPGATDYFYVATESGDFNVVATDNNNCEVEAAIFDVVAAIEHDAYWDATGNMKFEFYPNPANDHMTISTHQLNVNSISVYNVFGEKVIESILEEDNTHAEIKLDLSSLSSAFYIASITTSSCVYQIRFIKQ